MVDEIDKHHRAYFTNGSAAELLISMIPYIGGSVLEPTAGDGELIKAYLTRALEEGTPYAEAVENITAIEIQERHYLKLNDRLEKLRNG